MSQRWSHREKSDKDGPNTGRKRWQGFDDGDDEDPELVQEHDGGFSGDDETKCTYQSGKQSLVIKKNMLRAKNEVYACMHMYVLW